MTDSLLVTLRDITDMLKYRDMVNKNSMLKMYSSTMSSQMLKRTNNIEAYAKRLTKLVEGTALDDGSNIKNYLQLISQQATLLMCHSNDMTDQNLMEKGRLTLEYKDSVLDREVKQIVNLVEPDALLK